eukprot:CAMPEP_0184861300 /NCGR_PEP_ID=MMETSP0580-20130426/6007_1 /TAXON_ID=1118495 /ORGANISM="Dactyliosolen fragilissimus" /LENGTH=785 /DNA_ID=CAMNT_0027358729 /DNA_START=122 /DNA_END=2476 /DNA_ORIENTATION=-
MADSLAELRASYNDFLAVGRFNYADRIATAIDDYMEMSRNNGGGKQNSGLHNGFRSENVGWGFPRVKINLTELRSTSRILEQRLRSDPLRHLRALEAACHDVALVERAGYDKNGLKIKVAIAGPIGAESYSPRSLASSSLRQLVCVEGVATKVSAIKPKVVKSVHYCPETKKHESREYVDATDSQLGLPAIDSSGREIPDRIINITSSVYPTKDKDKKPLETEFGLSTYKDHQTVVLQEMPERAPMGQLPRSVELILDDDLVDKIKPGDRVQIVGVYRALSTAASGQASTSGVFKTVILVNNVQILGRDISHLKISPQDIRAIKSLGKRKDILTILGRSLAPSIHGHSVIKKALALQLLSGCEKNLANGTHLRGDINILMVGDPSTAKSQLLRSTMVIAPLAVSTTGKGSSGVGLTAAVTSDPDTKERRLEAGAMVLADRGIVCVDEFDKMSEADRVAIHEAMEQQTVTIAKAGIHASLNARCSVLAAANPVYGQYDRKRRIQENIGLPDSLLSRFDLLFVVLDQLDPDADRRIAAHVIQGHRYRPAHGRPGHDRDYDESDESDDDDIDFSQPKTQSIWQRSRNSVTNEYSFHTSTKEDPHSDDVLQHDFLRKYLHYSKTRIKPVLTDDARECIANRYAEMRSRQDERTLPVTARSLETIIRLASAHAKARHSFVVEAEPDCSVAMDILGFALYHENNDNIANVTDDEDATNSDSGDSDIEGNSKKQRLESDEIHAHQPSVLLPNQLWQEISGGETSIGNLCTHVTDRVSVMNALQRMADDGRIW